jgi:outer membrane protein TolC
MRNRLPPLSAALFAYATYATCALLLETPARAATPGPAKDIKVLRVTAALTGETAARTNYNAKAQESNLKAAAARVDQAWSSFLPHLELTARYTRLSPVSNPALNFGGPPGQATLVTKDPPGTENPKIVAVETPNSSFSFPVILDNFLISAQIVVPISDYFLRINQGHTAALHGRDAAEFDLKAAKAKAFSEGKIAYYTYLRAKGSLKVAEEALENVKIRTADVKAQAAVGNASQADVLRVETAISAAELQVGRIKNLIVLADKQLRSALKEDESTVLEVAEDVEGALPAVTAKLEALVAESVSGRAEVSSLDRNLEALRKQGSIAGAGAYPQVSGFGQLDIANPNQRRFPISPDFYPTWSLGLQATWSPNAILASGASSSEVDARVAALEMGKQQLLEGLDVEVTQAYQAVSEAELALTSSVKQIESATEALRVARELFRNGRATATLIADAETELTRARLEMLNAKVDARVARVRLDHATGRDLSALKR